MLFKRKRHQEDWERLTGYVAGEGSEQAEIRAWVAVDEEQARLLREIQTVWKVAENLRVGDDIDVDAAWKRLEAKVQQTVRIYPLPHAASPRPDGASAHGFSSQGTPPKRRQDAGRADRTSRLGSNYRPSRARRTPYQRPVAFHFLRIAGVLAIIVFAMVLAAQFWQLPGRTPAQPAYEVFATKRGERALVRLNDGTEVRLNVESRLTVPLQFSRKVREVYLEGEAYFEVAKDSLRPFIVRAGDACVEVLGTQFNVRAYPEKHEVEVVVAEGQIALSRSQAAVQDTVVLRARHLGLLKESGLQVMRHGINLDQYLGWASGRLVFADASFEDVARTLERRYNLRVEFRGSPRDVPAMDATFEKESLGNVLRVIAATLNLRYEWENDKITFFPAPPKYAD